MNDQFELSIIIDDDDDVGDVIVSQFDQMTNQFIDYDNDIYRSDMT